MAFLDWLKRQNRKAVPEPEDDPGPPRHFSEKGSPIEQRWESKWYSSGDGLHEFKHHMGHSIDGFHGGLEVSFRGGEHSFRWSNARPSSESAEDASFRMREAWERGDNPTASLDARRELRADWPRVERASGEPEPEQNKDRPGRPKSNEPGRYL